MSALHNMSLVYTLSNNYTLSSKMQCRNPALLLDLFIVINADKTVIIIWFGFISESSDYRITTASLTHTSYRRALLIYTFVI